jgi:hypothetical protein
MSLSIDHAPAPDLRVNADLALRTDRSTGPTHSPVALRRIARGYARDLDLISSLPVSTGERTWVRLPTAPDLAAWMIRWPVGTSTGWHDHIGENGGVRGTFVVVRGLLLESTWSGSGVLKRRLGPGGTRSFGPTYVHDVSSIGDEAAVSVHVYSPQLTAMRTYSIDSGQLELTGIGPLDEW